MVARLDEAGALRPGHLQLESILAFDTEDEHDETDGTKDLNGLFAQLARETSGIQDIELLVDALPVAAAS